MRRVPRREQGGGSTSNVYFYDVAGRKAVETDGSLNVLRTEIYAGNRDLATYQGSGMLHHTNWLDPEAARSDGSGNLCETISSLPFGDATDQRHLFAFANFFTGKERDSESGNDYFGARYYASAMGRFLMPDPSGLYFANPLNPQSLNLYNYGLNNPLINIDPTGLDCIHINNDTGAFEGFESGDCNNSTPELANTGQYVDATVNSIGFNSQNQVIGYGTTTGSEGNFASFAGSTNMNVGPAAAFLNPYTGAVTSPGETVNVNGNSPTGPNTNPVSISNQIPRNGLQPPSNIPVMRAYTPPAQPNLQETRRASALQMQCRIFITSNVAMPKTRRKAQQMDSSALRSGRARRRATGPSEMLVPMQASLPDSWA